MKLFFLLTLFFNFSVHAEPLELEADLLEGCGKKDLLACEKLGALYMGKSEWDKAFMVGEALCEKEIGTGCMMAGSSRLAQGNVKEGSLFLTAGCDKFEPLSCRSLGRLMIKAGEKAMANIYFKRACHYGLKDICPEINVKTNYFSPAAKGVLAILPEDCQDTQSNACRSLLQTVQSCALPLNKLDCQLLAGYLSIYFRAKLTQAEAKVSLLTLHSYQQTLKASKDGGFSYDLSTVLKNANGLEKYKYVFGFMSGCGKKYLKAKKPLTHSHALYPGAYKQFGPRETANVLEYFSRGMGEDCYDPKAGYEAYAVASLDPLNPSRLDVWKVDQDRRVEHVMDGLPLP